MFSNYVKIALRSLRKHPGYTFINVSGLAIGLLCTIFILLWIRDELSYDQHISNGDRIYRVYLDARIRDRDLKAPVSPSPMGFTMTRDFPEVVQATRLFTFTGKTLIKRDDRQFLEDRYYLADSTFFEVFDLPFVAGDPRTALDEPNSVVLTEHMAKKYFPEGNAMGKSLIVTDTNEVRITGILKDLPTNQHFHPDILASFNFSQFGNSWLNNSLTTYLLVREGADPTAIEAKIPVMFKKYGEGDLQQFTGQTVDQFLKSGNKMDYRLQPVHDIHLTSHMEFEIEPNGNIIYVYLFGAIAFFILLLACINFMNLATARSAGRAREVGMRKVLGSLRQQLIAQFLSESILLSVVALILAVVGVVALIPLFNTLAGKEMGIMDVFDLSMLPFLLLLVVMVGLLSGSYPALFLSSFQPITVLKGQFVASKRGIWLRRSLVVFQFGISILLMIGTAIVFNQLNYVRNKSLGFDKEYIVVIKRAEQLGQQTQTFKDEIRQNRQIVQAGGASTIPGSLFGQTGYRPEGVNADVSYIMSPMAVDYDWIETMNVGITTGRDFEKEFSTDTSAYVINEAAARKMSMKEPVGQKLTLLGNQRTNTIIGVVKDFHTASLHQEIGPLVVSLANGPLPFLCVRIRPNDINGSIQLLKKTWEQFVPGQPFEYAFLDQEFDSLYKADQQLGKIFTTFAVLAIVIACLGLFGLASFMTQQRTKEVGVRKAMGASATSVIVLVSREFTMLVVLAFLVASPLAYLAMLAWLQDFAYHVSISPLSFILAGLLALIIAWITVSYQALKAASVNPVTALRYE